MSVLIGKNASVVVNGATVAEMGQFSYSGITRDSVEVTAFGDSAKDFVPTMADPGDITFSGSYDPSDTNGQIVLETACEAGTEYGPADIKFYIATNTYLTPENGGVVIITKVKAISMDKAGVGTIEIAAKVSGAPLEQLND